MKRELLYVGIICWLIPLKVLGQEDKKKEIKRDSTKVYKGIKRFAEKRKFTYWIYQSVFKEAPKPLILHRKVKGKKRTYKDNYANYKEKVIRNIHIQTLDPFGVTIY